MIFQRLTAQAVSSNNNCEIRSPVTWSMKLLFSIVLLQEWAMAEPQLEKMKVPYAALSFTIALARIEPVKQIQLNFG